MLLNFLAFLFFFLVSYVASFLPVADPLPDAVFGWIGYFQTGSQILGIFLPLGTFYTVLALFIVVEAALLNPVFFVGALWAMLAIWKPPRENPLGLYLFCMGGLVFLGHLAFSLHSHVLPNWIAPAALPMFAFVAG